jgi:xanthine dehydrogenase YagR molybdenum-binding subunit
MLDAAEPDASGGGLIGAAIPRIEGRAKVTGRAVYAADEAVANPAFAFLVTSTIARGHIRRFALEQARAVPGVLDILTYENVGGEADPPPPHGAGGETTTMQTARIWHDGQIIAVVVADSFEAAREAAQKVDVDYEEETPSATFGSAGVEVKQREPGEHKDFCVGDADAAFASAAATVDQRYGTPTQHHNPMELFSTTAVWQDGSLILYEPSQFVYGLRGAVAKQLRMNPKQIRVVARHIGGAFGSKGIPSSRTAWIAVAARRLGRPVKFVATRDQCYTIATYRAETQHHIRLGAEASGKLVALRHEGWEVTSRPSDYNVSGTETTARMYACANILTKVNVVHADRNTPGFMRAPPDVPYMFPLECAMDELAEQLGIDPVELRRINDTQTDPATGQRFSSRSLMRCFDVAAERFGWAQRDPAPRSHREGDWLVGWGCASAAYPANIGAGAARIILETTGVATVKIAAHDIGTGSYTIIAQTAAERLGLPMDQIVVQIGDTDLPPAGLAAGSSHASGIVHAVALACEQLRARLARDAAASNGPLAGHDAATIRLENGMLVGTGDAREKLTDALSRSSSGALEAYAENVPKGQPHDSIAKLYGGQMSISRGTQRSDFTTYAFGAQFVEVRVHARTCEIRVPRAVGAFAAGRIINPRTAHSQLMGGMIWGISSALHEITDIDKRFARYMNDDLSEYHIPVHADVRQVDAMLVAESDKDVNPVGMKGVGEIGIVGMNAAIANAVYHATGRRLRQLPIRVDSLL